MRKQFKRNMLAMLALSSAIALGLGAASLTASADEATLPEGYVDIYLIAGQSNAVGYSPVGTENATYENVWYVGDVNRNKDKNGAAANMGDVSTYENVTVGMGKDSTHIGPEYGMAKALNDYYTSSSRKALLIKSAAGGTHIAYTGGESATFGNWLPSSLWDENDVAPSENGDTDPNGVQYYHFIENFKAAYTELKAEGYTPVVKGMVWMQGESDVATPNYETLLSTLIDDFRNDIYAITADESCKTLPFIVGEISSPMCADYLTAFTATQKKTVDSKANAYLVKSNDLSYMENDKWHLTTEGAVTLGERFGLMLAENANICPTADVVVSGASVYIGASDEDGVDKNGIRFRILAKEEILQKFKVHALLVPADLVDNTELGQGMRVNDGKSMVDEELTDWFASEHPGYKETYVTLYNFSEDAYNREILVNAYWINSSGVVWSHAKTISRSMAYVALRAEQNGNDLAAKYIKSYNVDFYGEDQTEELRGYESVTVRYGSLVAEPEVEDTETKSFVGWYTDKAFTKPFDFSSDTITGTTKLYSKWEDLQTVTGSYAYTSGNYSDGKITNAGDTVTVKSGDRTGTVDTDTQNYSIKLPVSVKELTLSSAMFRDVKVSIENDTAATAKFSVPKMTPEVSVNKVTYTEDGFMLTHNNSNTNVYWFGEGVVAKDGFVVTYTLASTNTAYYRLGGLAMGCNDTTYALGFISNGALTGSKLDKNNRLFELDNDCISDTGLNVSVDVSVTIVYYNEQFYVIASDESTTKVVVIGQYYTKNWTDRAFDYNFCKSSDKKLGVNVSGGSENYKNVSYRLGNAIAKETLETLGISQSYTLATGKIQMFKDNATTQSGEGFVVTWTQGNGGDWANGGLVMKTGDYYYTFGTAGTSIIVNYGTSLSGWGSTMNINDVSVSSWTSLTLSVAYYGETFYVKWDNGTTTGTFKFNASSSAIWNDHKAVCSSAVKSLGLVGPDGNKSNTFTNVSYEIGDETAKTAITAMGFELD